VSDYCREIEAHLCRKNEGHLIRIVGPSFELVSGWESAGVPIKVALTGIDRFFERYYRKGSRRRPVRIDYCDADVQDVFDEWRRAVGVTATAGGNAAEGEEPESDGGGGDRRRASLASHLERVLLRLTDARVAGRLGDEADVILDELSRELDRARATPRGLRGEARHAAVERLALLDRRLLDLAHHAVSETDRTAYAQAAGDELTKFRPRMTPAAYERAHAAIVDRYCRDRLQLPTLSFL
jgi:hypothetical protein